MEELIEKLPSQTLTKDEYIEAAELLEAIIMADYRKVSIHLSQILDTIATPPPNDHRLRFPAQRSDGFSPLELRNVNCAHGICK
jgi:hypothetical protein